MYYTSQRGIPQYSARNNPCRIVKVFYVKGRPFMSLALQPSITHNQPKRIPEEKKNKHNLQVNKWQHFTCPTT